jgi:hypothetical protein
MVELCSDKSSEHRKIPAREHLLRTSFLLEKVTDFLGVASSGCLGETYMALATQTDAFSFEALRVETGRAGREGVSRAVSTESESPPGEAAGSATTPVAARPDFKRVELLGVDEAEGVELFGVVNDTALPDPERFERFGVAGDTASSGSERRERFCGVESARFERFDIEDEDSTPSGPERLDFGVADDSNSSASEPLDRFGVDDDAPPPDS